MNNKPTYEELEKRVRDLEKAEAERKQAEEILREREQFLSRVINENPFPIWIGDKHGTIIQCNKALLDLLKLKENQLVGKYNILRDPLIKHLREGIRKIFDKGETWTFEVQWDAQPSVGAESSLVVIEGVVFPVFNLKGNIVNTVAIYHDITERKQAEIELAKHRDHLEELVDKRTSELKQEIKERKLVEKALRKNQEEYRLLFENMIDGFAHNEIICENGLPVDYRFLAVNPAFERLTGLKSEAVIGKKALEVLPNLEPDWIKKFGEVALTGIPVSFENYVQELNRFYQVSVFRPAINQFACVFTDTTLRKKYEEQIQQAQKMEAISILAGGIAHDFNNILSVIMGNISFALSKVNHDELIYQLLENALHGTEQGQKLTNQLLTFAKGCKPIKKQHNINNLLEDAVNFTLSGANSKSNFYLEKDLWSAEVDAGQVNQAISNLIINADQAMPDGGIIRLKTENIDLHDGNEYSLNAGPYIKISVTDQGIGIQKQHISNIFDPFFTTKHQGSGLGLSTTYSIIKNHNGHIVVNSELGKGTVFSIYLPALKENPRKIKVQKKSGHQGQGKILMMDDEKLIRDIAEKILSTVGYETKTAPDGAKAIELFKEAYSSSKPYDLVILDLTVPGGMGGAETVPELMKIDPKIKVVASSGYSNNPVMSNYKDYGFCGVIPKPYSLDQLLETINRIINE